MKNVLLLLSVLIQLEGLAQQGGWEQFHNNQGAIRGEDIKPTSDGGYIMTGFANPTNTLDGQDIMLMKIDGDGNFEWSKNFNPGGSTEYGWSLIETFDQEFALVGSASSPLTSSTDGYFILTDELGNVKKQWFLGDSQYNFLTDIIQLPTDSSFVACGDWGDRPFIVRMDKNGDTLFTKIYPEVIGRFYALEYSPEDQSIVLAGVSAPLQYAGLVAKVDIDGNLIWLQEYIGGGFEEIYDISSKESNLAVTGRSSQADPDSFAQFFLRILDNNGEEIVFQNFGQGGFKRIIQNENIGYLLVSTKYIPVQSQIYFEERVYVVKTDTLGNVIWEKEFGENYPASNLGESICLGHDYGYVICGQFTSLDGVTYVYIIKIDENGSIVRTNSFPYLPEVVVYPNPCIDLLNIELGHIEGEKFITIYNSSGQEIYSTMTWENKIQINEINHWQSGVYAVRIRLNGHEVVRKVVK